MAKSTNDLYVVVGGIPSFLNDTDNWYGAEEWSKLVNWKNKQKVVVLASGEGSNFSAIVEFGIEVDKVITDNKKANVIKRAEKVGVPCIAFDRKGGDEKYGSGWCDRMVDESIPEDVGLIVLAGYMRILSPYFIKKWKDKIVNIHPSLLPAFGGGCHAIRDAWEHGCKVFGVTVHWVTEEVDAGPIIAQESIHDITGKDDLEFITSRIHTLEHSIYPKTIKEILTKGERHDMEMAR